MLIQQRQTLNEQILQLQEHQNQLDDKIAFYHEEIKKQRGEHLSPDKVL